MMEKIMPQIKKLLDEYGILLNANAMLSCDLKISLIESLAELENNDSHIRRSFPKTRLHRVEGIKNAIYRADIDKISGWRIHLQYRKNKSDGEGGVLVLKDIIEGKKHDDVIEVIKSKKERYD
jgi:hypothetical protein